MLSMIPPGKSPRLMKNGSSARADDARDDKTAMLQTTSAVSAKLRETEFLDMVSDLRN